MAGDALLTCLVRDLRNACVIAPSYDPLVSKSRGQQTLALAQVPKRLPLRPWTNARSTPWPPSPQPSRMVYGLTESKVVFETRSRSSSSEFTSLV